MPGMHKALGPILSKKQKTKGKQKQNPAKWCFLPMTNTYNRQLITACCGAFYLLYVYLKALVIKTNWLIENERPKVLEPAPGSHLSQTLSDGACHTVPFGSTSTPSFTPAKLPACTMQPHRSLQAGGKPCSRLKGSQAERDLDAWPWPISTLLSVTNRVTDSIRFSKHLSSISVPADCCLFRVQWSSAFSRLRVVCISRQKGRF